MYYEVFKLHADLLKAMSHPKRLEIIQLLREKELSVSQIQEMLGLSQANLSQHLMILRDAEIVLTRKNGKQVYYGLSHKNFIKASDLLREVLIERHKNDGFGDELLYKMTDLVPLAIDPVCGMRLSPKTASYAHKIKGISYYFCAEGCLEEFKKDLKKYTRKYV
jgi:ArsR family transcriptional regulator, virulence genes transcriptional regulator